MKLNKLFLPLAITFVASVASCGGQKDENKLTVATNATFEPFEYKDSDGNFLGIDMDIVNQFAQSNGYELEITDIDFDSIVPSIQTSKADIGIAGLTKTDERSKIVDFTDSYYSASQVVIVPANSSIANSTSKDEILSYLENKTIGCQSGTTGESYITGSSDLDFTGISGATCRPLSDGYLACKSLNDGQLDAVIIDKAPAELYVKTYTNLKVLPVTLTEEEYAIAVKKGNTKLLNELNSFIKEIKENGKLDEIINSYNSTNN